MENIAARKRKQVPEGGSVPKVVEKGTGISYPIEKQINQKRRIYRVLEGERLKWQKVRMRAEDIAWIEEAVKALGQEPIRLGFLEEVLVA